MKKSIVFIVFVLVTVFSKAQLVINELSQGPNNTKEYVELLVTGSPVCGAANTVDLRGWIIDDNNSWHGTGSGAGIAGGHVRFANVSQWANVKIGTLILIYNDLETSAATDALTVDTTDANADCVFVVPVSSSVLDKNVTLPVSAGTMTTYNVGGTVYSSTGNWVCLGMANSADAFHTVSPTNYAAAYHSIGWGGVNNQLNVYYPANQGGLVIYMANTVDNDPFNAANFIDSSAATNETPGAPNNAANAAWISSLNHNCQPYTSPAFNISTPQQLTCANAEVVLQANSSSSGLTYTWSSGASNSNLDTVTTAGVYSVTVSDGTASCTASASVSVSQNTTVPDVTITSVAGSCSSNTDTLVASSTTSGVGFDWGNGVTGSQNIVSTAGTYYVTVTDPANGCAGIDSIIISGISGLSITVNGINTSCGNSNGSAVVLVNSGSADTFLWSNGGNNDTITQLAAGTYSVTVSTNSGCSATASVVIGSSGTQPPVINSDKTIMCSGDSAQVCAPLNYQSYLWNTGETTNCIYTKLAGNYYVTVTEVGNCTVASNAIAITVRPLPPVSISVNGDTLKAFNSITYQWFYNGSLIPNATQSVYVALQNGKYSVEVSDTNGCKALSNPVLINHTGINESNLALSVRVYPNPVENNQLFIEVPEILIGSDYSILDMESRRVSSGLIEATQTQIQAHLPKGTYLLRICSEKDIIARKLVWF
ncbi:MAG: T9SS type A sorting domain-containing protein [Chitinophagales bacterium]